MDIQWPLLFFGLLAGLSMGCLGVASFSELAQRFKELQIPLLVVSLVTLAVGGVVSALHMGHVDRVFYVLGNLASGISQELVATAVAGIVGLASLVAHARPAAPMLRRVLAVLGLAIALVLPFITGEAYVQGARPAWDTLFLPIMYVGAAGAMGLFAAWALAVARRAEAADVRVLGKAAFVATAVFAVTVALFLAAVAMAPYPHPTRSVARIVSGDLGVLFWGGVVAVGLAVPLAVSGRGSFTKPKATTEGVVAGSAAPLVIGAFICLLVGSAAIRMIMYLVGTSIQSFIY